MTVSAMAQATTTTTMEKIPFSFTETACNGETVDFEGFQKEVVQTTTSDSGQVNVKYQLTVHVKGVGQSTGAKYVLNETATGSENFDSSDEAPYIFTFV